MTHKIVITENGTGAGGTAEGEITWTPSHDLSGNEQMRRKEKAERIVKKALYALYDDGPEE